MKPILRLSLLLALTASAAQAQQMGGMDHSQHMMRKPALDAELAEHFKGIPLTDAQIRQVTEIKAKHHRAMEELRANPAGRDSVTVVRVTRYTRAARIPCVAVSATTTSGADAPSRARCHSLALKVRRRNESPARRVHSATRSASAAASAAERSIRRRSFRHSPTLSARPVLASSASASVSESEVDVIQWSAITG